MKNKLLLFISIVLLTVNELCFAKIPNADLHPNMEIRKKIYQAEDLFDAALFEEAIPLYREVLQAMEAGDSTLTFEQSIAEKIDSEIRIRLAQALFQVRDYNQAVTILSKHYPLANHQFLLGAAYRKNHDFDQAIAVFQSYLNNRSEEFLKHHEEALFELALSFYDKKDLIASEKTFESLLNRTKNRRLQILSNFYLSRISLTNKLFDLALQPLDKADQLLTEQDILKYESAFLRGKIYYRMKNYEQAIHAFEKALPGKNLFHAKWHEDTLTYLGESYLKVAENDDTSPEKREKAFQQTGFVLTKLLEGKPKERSWLAQGRYLLALGLRSKDQEILKKAEEIFSDPTKLISQESKQRALLLKAQSHLNYAERDRRFRQLTRSMSINHPLYAHAWYLHGLNDFKEGQALKNNKSSEEANKFFCRAAFSFEKAATQSAEARVLQAHAYYEQGKDHDCLRALNTLDPLWENEGTLLATLSDPLVAHTLYSQIASRFPTEYPYIEKLEQGLTEFPNSSHRSAALNLLAVLLYEKGDYSKAEETFKKLAEEDPSSAFAPEALYRASQCAEKQLKDKSIIRAYRQHILTTYPSAFIAPEASFTLFSYQDYLQSDREAIKHLYAFRKQFPESPYVLNTLFLIGLDNKRERKTEEGKQLKKNLLHAIDSFQEIESSFETLFLQNKIPESTKEHYLLLRYRAMLEKGITHLSLANESLRAKKHIYLEYARDALHLLLQQLSEENNPYKQWMTNPEPFWHLEEEGAYWLAQAHLSANELGLAEKVLTSILDKYHSAKITRGYFLSRILSLQGVIAMNKNEYTQALDFFLYAEDAAKGKVLNTDQKLDLLIQQSLCLKELNQLEKALLILSKVINHESVSSLRVKAMFLRAEIYEKQERYELMRKQLEATSKKGGEWSLKAKEKLEKTYGYR